MKLGCLKQLRPSLHCCTVYIGMFNPPEEAESETTADASDNSEINKSDNIPETVEIVRELGKNSIAVPSSGLGEIYSHLLQETLIKICKY